MSTQECRKLLLLMFHTPALMCRAVKCLLLIPNTVSWQTDFVFILRRWIELTRSPSWRLVSRGWDSRLWRRHRMTSIRRRIKTHCCKRIVKAELIFVPSLFLVHFKCPLSVGWGGHVDINTGPWPQEQIWLVGAEKPCDVCCLFGCILQCQWRMMSRLPSHGLIPVKLQITSWICTAKGIRVSACQRIPYHPLLVSIWAKHQEKHLEPHCMVSFM